MPLDYSVLKAEVLSKSDLIPQSDLDALVRKFSKIINSKRRSSTIKNCDDLVSVLEKRGYLTADNVEPLEFIMQRIPPSTREQFVSRFLTEQAVYNGNVNDTFGGRIPYISADRLGDDVRNLPIPNKVLELISEEMGKKWRELARKLGLRQGEVDQIEGRFRGDIKQITYECLLKFMHKTPYQDVECKLLSALEEARRNDLRKQVERLLKYH